MICLKLYRNISCRKLNIAYRYYGTKSTQDEFIAIYKFPYIRACGIINQLKYYQTIITTICIPTSILLFNYGLITTETVVSTSAMGISGTLSLFLLGIIPYKLIGFIYINKDNKTVKLSYLDFWGRRKDILLPLSDLIPISDLPAIPTDLVYLTMRRFSSSDTFKINLKYGIVLEKKLFKNIFLQD